MQKLIWASIFLCCVGSCTVIFLAVQKSVRIAAEIEVADGLWDRGERAAAVGRYKTVYDDASSKQKIRIVSHILEFEALANNSDETKIWVGRALSDSKRSESNVILIISSWLSTER